MGMFPWLLHACSSCMASLGVLPCWKGEMSWNQRTPFQELTGLGLLQGYLKGEHVVMADTGDCIFWTQQLKLPYGAGWVPQPP